MNGIHKIASEIAYPSGLIGHMPAESHDRHQEKQRDQEKKDSRYRVIAHAAGAFEPCALRFIAIHPAIRGVIGPIPAAVSTRRAANSANR